MTASSARPTPSPIRAVVLDVDGTLLDRDGAIPEANRLALRALADRDIPVILATGRIPSETVGYYRELALATPLVCYHGALVLSGDAGRPLLDLFLDADLARDLCDEIIAAQPDAQLLLGLADRYVINRMGELARHWDMSGPSRPTVGHLADAFAHRIYKVCCFSPDLSRAPQVARLIADRFADRVQFQQAHAHLVEFLAPGASKAAGADLALRAVGRSWAETLAVGDYHNDEEMVRRAAIGVAMGNAIDSLKAVADFVTSDRDAAGVAQAIRRFIP